MTYQANRYYSKNIEREVFTGVPSIQRHTPQLGNVDSILGLKSLFTLRDNNKKLRGINKLVLRRVRSTWNGVRSISYVAAKAWNSLPDNLRSTTNIGLFNV